MIGLVKYVTDFRCLIVSDSVSNLVSVRIKLLVINLHKHLPGHWIYLGLIKMKIVNRFVNTLIYLSLIFRFASSKLEALTTR